MRIIGYLRHGRKLGYNNGYSMPYVNKVNPESQTSDKTQKGMEADIASLVSRYFDHVYKKRKFEIGSDMIETAGKSVGREELINGVMAVLEGWWTEGRYAKAFVKALSSYLGVRYGVLTNSGSSANLVAFASLTSPLLGSRQVKKGDEVITVAAAFPTTVNPIIQLGAVPVFVDIDLKTLNIDTRKLSRAVSPKTKAIMIAHTQGNPFDVRSVVAFAKKHNLWLIEDACDALGATFGGKKVGSFGDLATFSFYPAHQMTMGEGGAVVTNNSIFFRVAESFRDWGRDCWCKPGEDNACRRRFTWKFKNLPYGYDHKFVYSHLGYNLKLTDMQAAIGLAQLQRIDSFVEKRRQNYKTLIKRLAHLRKYFIFQEEERDSDPSWFGFMVTLTDSCRFTITDICAYLNQYKVATRPLYCGNIVKQPYFEHVTYRISGGLPNTDYVMEHTFWIGVHPRLTLKMIDYIGQTIDQFITINHG